MIIFINSLNNKIATHTILINTILQRHIQRNIDIANQHFIAGYQQYFILLIGLLREESMGFHYMMWMAELAFTRHRIEEKE